MSNRNILLATAASLLSSASCCPYLRENPQAMGLLNNEIPVEHGRLLLQTKFTRDIINKKNKMDALKHNGNNDDCPGKSCECHGHNPNCDNDDNDDGNEDDDGNNDDDFASCVQITAAYCNASGGVRNTANKANTCAAYNGIKTTLNSWVTAALASSTPVLSLSTIYGAAVRLAFHDAGEVNMSLTTDMLGPDGCLSSTGDNSGLIESTSIVYTKFEPLWQSYCTKISRADFWVLLAKLCLEKADPTGTLSIKYQFGRKDVSSCSGGKNRLPSALGDLTEYRRVFVTQMGLTLSDATILLGAHSLGHVHPANTGFGKSGDTSSGLLNAWDDTPHIFDNHYHFGLESNDWVNQLAPYRMTSIQAQWTSYNSSWTIMLPSDMALGYQLDFGYSNPLTRQVCGPHGAGTQDSTGLGRQYGCSPANTTMPETCPKVCDAGNNNALFLSSFSTAFTKMTCVGYGIPANTDGATATGKLGTLTYIDLTTC